MKAREHSLDLALPKSDEVTISNIPAKDLTVGVPPPADSAGVTESSAELSSSAS